MNFLQNKRNRSSCSLNDIFNQETINMNLSTTKISSNISNNKEEMKLKENDINNFNNIFTPYNAEKCEKKLYICKNYDNYPFTDKRIKLFFSPPSYKIQKFFNYDAFISHNFIKLPNLDFITFTNNKSAEESKINFPMNNHKSIGSENSKKHFSIQKEFKNNNIYKINKINSSTNNSPNTNLFMITEMDKKISQISETSKPFQTYNTNLLAKNCHNLNKPKSNQQKVFHIEKIYNKQEYKDANEKESDEEDKNLKNRFKINLKKIKQIYTNSCLKIYSFMNDKVNYDETNLNDEKYICMIIEGVCEILKNKKISSSKMNEILQLNDDDKYRKHYFMFTSEAKQFCLDLIETKKLSFDVVMKMCKVPRKSLRRWSHVGCNRKKGCGRKTRNPEMESKLVEWVEDTTKNHNINVTSKMIRDKAVEISEDKDFLASKGWLEKFKKKFNIRISNHKTKSFKKISMIKDKNHKFNKDNIKIRNNSSEKNNNEIELNESKMKEKEIKKSESITKSIDGQYKLSLGKEYRNGKKPIFYRTKVLGKGNSKRFNVYKYSLKY